MRVINLRVCGGLAFLSAYSIAVAIKNLPAPDEMYLATEKAGTEITGEASAVY
ncbi:MAG: hypothetical protein IPP36_04440 [Nitrosomonadales bacterium]|nr:hypothetical protein [Nitrosomonadales bacterium]